MHELIARLFNSQISHILVIGLGGLGSSTRIHKFFFALGFSKSCGKLTTTASLALVVVMANGKDPKWIQNIPIGTECRFKNE